MEDLFKVMGDVLNPNRQVEADNQDIKNKEFEENFKRRADAFHELVMIVENVKDRDDRKNLFIALKNYIQAI
jgi:hypothetical protein